MNKAFKSVEEWCAYAERELETIERKYEEADIDEAKKKINLMLQECGECKMKEVDDFVNSDYFLKIESLIGTFRILSILSRISVNERKEDVTPILAKINSLEEMEYVYYKTDFLIRRLELDFPRELCLEFLSWMNEWKFSSIYLITMLQYKDLNKSKRGGDSGILEKTGRQLGNILLENGYKKEGEEILLWLLNV